MQSRSFSVAPAAIVVAVVLALAMIMFAVTGLAEALVLLAVVAVLAGMYALRHYARAKLIYRRPSEPAGTASAARRDA